MASTPPPSSSSAVRRSNRRSNRERRNIVERARDAMATKQYDIMFGLMNRVVDMTDNLTEEERELLSVAYEGVFAEILDTRNLVQSEIDDMSCGKKETDEQTDEETDDDETDVPSLLAYMSEIESEVLSFCNEILSRLDSRLIPLASDDESKLFYLKMKGDYGRYLVELTDGAEREKALEDTLSAYRSAQEIATEKLSKAHPMWLKLAVKFSAFYSEIYNSPESAVTLSKQAYDEALKELATREEESRRQGLMDLAPYLDQLLAHSQPLEELFGSLSLNA